MCVCVCVDPVFTIDPAPSSSAKSKKDSTQVSQSAGDSTADRHQQTKWSRTQPLNLSQVPPRLLSHCTQEHPSVTGPLHSGTPLLLALVNPYLFRAFMIWQYAFITNWPEPLQSRCRVFLDTQRRFTVKGDLTNHHQPSWVMHGSQSAPERSPHTSLRWSVRELMSQPIMIR